jgi:hypothetical protein
MTTALAARYCGFKTTAAIRKAFGEGRPVPGGGKDGKTETATRETVPSSRFSVGVEGIEPSASTV